MNKIYLKIFNITKLVLFSLIKIWDSVFKINKNKLIVLAYHGISQSKDFYSINLSDFKKQIEFLKTKSKFVSLDEVLKTINGEEIKGSSVVLTIDDGYENVLEILPFIEKNNIPVALFVLSDSQSVDRKEIANPHKFLSISQIKSLKKQGWTIGSHGATHRDFSRLSQKQMTEEIVNSKKTLEKKLGFEIKYFAFPKGSFNPEILKVVEKAGYEAAFATTPGSIKKDISKFIIPRTVINKSHQMENLSVITSNTTYFLRNVFGQLISQFYREG